MAGPVVAVVVPVLVVPAPYGWAVGVGGGFALLALLFTPRAAPGVRICGVRAEVDAGVAEGIVARPEAEGQAVGAPRTR